MRILPPFLAAWLLQLGATSLPPEDCPETILGLWGAEAAFDVQVRGEIVVARTGESWRANVGASAATVTKVGDRITIALPKSKGEFRGRLADSGKTIVGQWIQAPLDHVWGPAYATPLVLRSFRPNAWHGEVRPLDDAEAIYLRISADSSGGLAAIVRNPERNLGRYLGRMRVFCRNRSVGFVRGASDTLWATLQPSQSVMSLYLPTETATFDLTKRNGRNAPGFFPRATTEYRYELPLPRDDGWPTGSLRSVGIDSARIAGWLADLVAREDTSLDAPFLQGILIARHGKLVVEEYFRGYDADRVHDIRSAGKSITATMFGVARRLNPGLSTKDRVLELLPQYRVVANDGPAKRAMTVEDLLTMRSGLAADDDNSASPGNEDRLMGHSDRVKFTLDLPMASTPGIAASYSAATMNLIGPIVEQSSGLWLPEFIFERFARPLDIEHYHVPLGPRGDAYMGGGMLMRPRDFIKLGQLFLSNGRWRGRAILDSSWVAAATRVHSTMGPGDYGYGWWLRDVRVGTQTFHTYRAAGNGGQLVIVIPELDMVVGFVGANYNQGPVWWPWNDVFIPDIVIPAALARTGAARGPGDRLP